MRVLLWSELYPPYIGGAETFAGGLAQELRGRGVEYLVVTSHHDRELPDEDVVDGIAVRRLPMREAIAAGDPAGLIGLVRTVGAIKREFAADLVHLNAIGPSALVHLMSAGPSPPPLLVTLQQEVLASQADGGGTVLARVVEQADWVVACSDRVLRQLRAAHPDAAPRSSRIYNGVAPPPLDPGPPPEPPHVAYLGRLVPAKDVGRALRAFALLAESRPGVRFTIGGDGEERDALRRLAAELGLAGRVSFPGWVAPQDVSGFLADASVLVMPSLREGLPLVAVQAALAGRPVVATRVGGLPEIVCDGESGILVDDASPETLAAAVGRLLDEPQTAQRMGARARRHALDAFAWEAIVAAYADVYSRLVSPGACHDRAV